MNLLLLLLLLLVLIHVCRYMVCYGSVYSIFNLGNQFHGGYFRLLLQKLALLKQTYVSCYCSINEFMWLDFVINMGLGYCMTGTAALPLCAAHSALTLRFSRRPRLLSRQRHSPDLHFHAVRMS